MRGPVFVIGMPRSGTTMLRLALTSHDAICIPPESPFMISLHRRFGDLTAFDRTSAVAFVDALNRDPNALERRWQTPLDQLLDADALVGLTYASACARIYRNYARAHEPEAEWWGDKNNPFRDHIPTLMTLYPAARFVHLVRDGRALLASAQQLATIQSTSSYFPRLPVDVVASAAEWVHGVGQITRQLSGYDQSRWCQVRYEDLVTDFEAEMTTICQMLGLSYQSSMRDFDVANRNRSLEPAEYDEWKGRTRNPLTAERADAWTSALSQSDAELYSALAAPALRRFGYGVSARPTPSPGHRAHFQRQLQTKRLRSFARRLRARVGR